MYDVLLKQSDDPYLKTETTNLNEIEKFRFWDDYTYEELIELKKNERAIYISLYMVKYGFAPQNL